MVKHFLIAVCAVMALSSFAADFDCSRKTCKEMSSCEEALHKLKQCGHRGLDRDSDNVPCENICPGG